MDVKSYLNGLHWEIRWHLAEARTEPSMVNIKNLLGLGNKLEMTIPLTIKLTATHHTLTTGAQSIET
jgi:hypothetical protein